MSHPTTLVDWLRRQATIRGDATAYQYLSDGDVSGSQTVWSFAEIDRRARRVAVALMERQVDDPVLLLYPPGPEFIAGLFGCFYAGVVAVPAYPPDPNRLQRTLPRLQAIARDAGAGLVLTDTLLAAHAPALFPTLPELANVDLLATDGLEEGLEADWKRPPVDGETLAFLQYTSGSTAAPRGVVVRHGNALANIASARHMETRPESTTVAWLPLYHDLGLVGFVLSPVRWGFRSVLMAPGHFLTRPRRWVEALSHFRATHTAGPTFGYELVARKAGQVDDLDLSTLRVAGVGAEPVRAAALDRFLATFGPCGFRPQVFQPTYGMAESVLYMSFKTDLDAVATRLSIPESGGRTLVSCGWASPDHEMIIVDPETGQRVADGQVGEIWFRGPSVADGYWRRPKETEATFGAWLADGDGPWLRTGDLAQRVEGEMYFASRLKDLIIVRGRNLHPHDIEATVEAAHGGLRPGGGAAFTCEVEGEDRLAIVQEVRRAAESESVSLVKAIRRAVVAAHGVVPTRVVLIKQGATPKTSSGKVQRRACRRLLEQGELPVVIDVITHPDGVEVPGAPPPGPDAGVQVPLPADPDTAVAPALTILEGMLGYRPSPDEDLTELGLDSLQLHEFLHALQERVGVTVDPRRLVPGTRLIEVLRSAAGGAAPVGGPSTATLPDRHPASEVQELFFAEPEFAHGLVLHLRGPAQQDVIARTIDHWIGLHALLRSQYRAVEGQLHIDFAQRAAVPPLQYFDATSWADGDVQQALDAEHRRPFRLTERQAPVRALLYRRGPKEHVLALFLHHLTYDAVTLAYYGNSLIETLDAVAAGRPLEEPDPGADYRRYLLSEAAYLRSPECEMDRRFWSDEIGGVDMFLPLGERRAGRGHLQPMARRAPRLLPAGLPETLRGFCRAQRVTTASIYLTALFRALHRLTSQNDLVVGLGTSLREWLKLPRVEGPVLNFVPFRHRVVKSQITLAEVQEVHQALQRALAHRRFPYRRFEGIVADPQGPNVWFNFQPISPAIAATPAFRLRRGEIVPAGGLKLQLASRGWQDLRTFDLNVAVSDFGSAHLIQLHHRLDPDDPGWAVRLDGLLADAVSEMTDLAAKVAMPALSPPTREHPGRAH